MQVLAITNMYPPHHYGGYEVACATAMDHLVGAGHAVHVLTSDHRVAGRPTAESHGDGPGVAVERVLPMYWRDHDVLDVGAAGRLRIERRALRSLARTLRRVRPDVVSVWAMGGLSMGLLSAVADAGIPMVAVICDDWPIYGPVLDGWHRALRSRPRLDRAVASITGFSTSASPWAETVLPCYISDVNRHAVMEHSPFGLPSGPVVHCGVDDLFLRPLAPPSSGRPELDAADSRTTGFSWRLVHHGRLDDRKGVDTAIRALPLLPEATLSLYVRGDDRVGRALRSLAEDLGVADRVTLTDVERDALPALLGQGDVYVFPTRWSEPLGLAPLEAMGCGVPVVATGTGGSGEYLVDGRTCLRFEVDDHVGMAEAVERLAGDAALRADLRRRGRAVAESWSMARWVEVIEAWHHVAIGERRAADVPTLPLPDLFDTGSDE